MSLGKFLIWFLTRFCPAKAADEELPEAAEEAPEVEEQSAEADGPATDIFRVLA